MSKHKDLIIMPVGHPLRRGNVSCHRDPRANLKVFNGAPSVKCEERVICCRIDLLAGGDTDTKHLFRSTGKNMCHGAAGILQPLIESPDRNITDSLGEQPSQRYLFICVSA